VSGRDDEISHLGDRFVAAWSPLPEVRAIAVGGSQATGRADRSSDIDVYVFVDAVIPDERRLAVIRGFDPPPADLGLLLATSDGDEFHDGRTGIEIDTMYWDPGWFSDRVDAVTVRHEPSLGYSTCLWFTARHLRPLADRDGWLAGLQARAAVPYPDELRRRIVRLNTNVLRRTQSSYRHQLEKALARGDAVSVNHRTAVLVASCLDVVFAANRELHPGEKRLLDLIETGRLRTPAAFRASIEALVACAAVDHPGLLAAVDRLAASVEAFADEELREAGEPGEVGAGA
jgi:predicted nucleotidyltransferase